MRTLNSIKKIFYFAVSVVVYVSITTSIPLYAYDSDNLYKENSTSVFAPGYMNAAKYQAETILAQQTQHKTLLQNIIDYVQGKTESKVQENAIDTPKPVLQQKQSTAIRSKISAAASVAVNANPSPAEIPAYVRNSVQAYITQTSGAIRGTYQLKDLNGKYFAAWNDNSGALLTQFFTSQGDAIPGGPLPISGGGYIDNVSVLSSGNVAVFLEAYDSHGNDVLKAQFFNSQDNCPVSVTPTQISENNFNNIENVSVLSNGNIAVFWREFDPSWHLSLQVGFFNSQGSATSATTMLSEDSFVGFTSGATISKVSVLSNNNVAVFWNEGSVLKGQFLDSQGRPASSMTLTGNGSIYEVSVFSNGNVAAFWNDGDGTALKTQFFDSQGSPTLDPNGAPTSSITLTGENISYASICKVSPLSNGDVAVFWYECDNNAIITSKVQYFSVQGIARSVLPVALAGFMESVSVLSDGSVAVFCGQYMPTDDKGHYNFILQEHVFNSEGAEPSAPVTFTVGIDNNLMLTTPSISILSNGSVAVFWMEIDSIKGSGNVVANYYVLKAQIFASNGATISTMPVTLDKRSYSYSAVIDNVSVLSNGNVAVFWSEGGSNLMARFFNSSGSAISADSVTLTSGISPLNVPNISVLSNGNVAVFWNENDPGFVWALKTWFFDQDGNTISQTDLTGAGKNYFDGVIENVSMLPTGGIAVSYAAKDNTTGKYTFVTRVFDPQGAYLPIGSLTPPVASSTNIPDLSVVSPLTAAFYVSPYGTNDALQQNQPTSGFGYLRVGDSADNANGVLNHKGGLASDIMSASPSPEMIDNAAKDRPNGLTLAMLVPKYMNAVDARTTVGPTGVLNSPEDDKKVTLDTIKAFLGYKEKAKDKKEDQLPEIKKSKDDLLNAVANMLLAQAMPDLLKKGDVANIKTIFSELDIQKNEIMLEYARSTKPYYDNVLKDLAKNLAALHGKSLLAPGISKNELDKLPPSELDKILEKIKNSKARSFEEEYILQQEAKYRREYLEPNKMKMEGDMKNMLSNFSGKISSLLKTSDKK